jgi:hypothetical protein
MRYLLLHPEDSPDCGPWVAQAWDRVIDLGTASPDSYRAWTQKLNCPVTPLHSPGTGMEELGVLRNLLATGYGRLLDRQNFDWWELNSVFFEEQMAAVVFLKQFSSSLGTDDQISVTRPSLHADVMSLLRKGRVHCFRTRSSHRRGMSHYLRVFRKFPVSQLLEIFWDKYDAGYAFRGCFRRHRKVSQVPVVLLPTSYVNVSRTATAYASTLLDENFLLVATRNSGLIMDPPPNVGVAKLASYYSMRAETANEYGELLHQWQSVRRDLELTPEIAVLAQLGALESFPRLLRLGLGIRDAWLTVFDREPVKAVLCGDDSNPYTRLPLLLARNRGLPAIACHHGALDGRYLIKQNHADMILAKGRMEQDYLLRVCGLPREQVEIGAPVNPPFANESRNVTHRDSPSSIVFFSECYEAAGARCEEFYREILPPLAALALRTDRKLIIKLHPFESKHDRNKLIAKVLSAAEQHCSTVVSGPLTGSFLSRLWFGVTVLSTVALDCALAGRICFLCRWLDYGKHGYQEQLSRFGAGYSLKSAGEMARIPSILENYSINPRVVSDLWLPTTATNLRNLFSGERKLSRCAVR